MARRCSIDPGKEHLAELGLEPGRYHLLVARFEPENHVLEIVQGYVASGDRLPLVVVGSAPYADAYTAAIEVAANDRVRFLGAVWDQEQVNALYAHALSYLHGHSVGGTNPSLLRAAGAGAFTLAYDVSFNREVLGETADYFSSPTELAELLVAVEADQPRARARGADLKDSIRRYNWDDVADRYEALCQGLAERAFPGTGRPVAAPALSGRCQPAESPRSRLGPVHNGPDQRVIDA